MEEKELQLIIVEQIKPLELFTTENLLARFLADIRKKVMSIVPDMSTAAGRKDIASIAYKVAQTKATLDRLGKEEVTKLKELPKQVDAGRKAAREFLEALQEEYRRPLTEYEEAEKARIEAEELARQLEIAHGEALIENDLFNRQREIERREAELARIEAERLKKEQDEREAKERAEREEQIRKEAAERAQREAEAKAVRDREEAEKKIAEAKAAAERAEREKELAIQEAERRTKEDAERAERKRIEEEESKRAEDERRAANKRHRAKIKAESVRFIKGIYGTTEEQASGIFDAIATGAVPHITVNF